MEKEKSALDDGFLQYSIAGRNKKVHLFMWGWPFFTLLSKAPRRLYRHIGGGGFSFHRRLIKVAISFASITCYRLLS